MRPVWRYLAAALVCLPSPASIAQEGRVYQQSSAVRERFGDVSIRMDAPALALGHDLTTHDEMLVHLHRIAARTRHLARGTLGVSQQGREIPSLVFTEEGLSDAAQIRALARPIIWLIGQQHGNEPAGGEAMLALASALADGELEPLLDRITVVIVPRANPDGASAFTRATANGLDPNRDHLLLTLPEVQAIHAKLVELPADIVVDAHEFQAAGPWLAKFQGLQKSDAMLLFATHPAVPQELSRLAQTDYVPTIEAAFRPIGLSWFWYHTAASGDASDKAVSLGGYAPGIARNTFGLDGAVSLLVETRGIGIGLQGYQRRVATHYLAAKAVMERAAAEPSRLRETVAKAREASAAAKDPLIIGYKAETATMTIPLIDPQSATDRAVEVRVTDTRRVLITEKRPRPAGYLIQPEGRAAIEALKLRGTILCALASRPLRAEAFLVNARPGPVDRSTINPERSVRAALETRTVTPEPGAVYVPMSQPAGAIVAAALEPDSPGSYVGAGLLPIAASGEAPIYRVPEGTAAPVEGPCGP
jgi:hypothetical protein